MRRAGNVPASSSMRSTASCATTRWWSWFYRIVCRSSAAEDAVDNALSSASLPSCSGRAAAICRTAFEDLPLRVRLCRLYPLPILLVKREEFNALQQYTLWGKRRPRDSGLTMLALWHPTAGTALLFTPSRGSRSTTSSDALPGLRTVWRAPAGIETSSPTPGRTVRPPNVSSISPSTSITSSSTSCTKSRQTCPGGSDPVLEDQSRGFPSRTVCRAACARCSSDEGAAIAFGSGLTVYGTEGPLDRSAPMVSLSFCGRVACFIPTRVYRFASGRLRMIASSSGYSFSRSDSVLRRNAGSALHIASRSLGSC